MLDNVIIFWENNAWIRPHLNGIFYFWPTTLWRCKTTSPPFTVNAVMKKRAGWGLRAATTRTCCTQLACCRGTVWLSCLLLFRSEDKAVSEGTVPGKQAPTPTCLFIYTEAHNCGVPPHLACSEPNVHPLKLSSHLPTPTVLVLCPCHIYSLVAVGWNGVSS